VRAISRVLITLGACATAGGIQALRNHADVAEYASVVYARPDCPIDRRQLLDTITALLVGRRPRLPAHSVCFECKRRNNVCVAVAHGEPCLGPVTRAGCGAICPAFRRGCFGCFGPAESPNDEAQSALLRETGMPEAGIRRLRDMFGVEAKSVGGPS
jgi:sulfhydrogenase subunit delta